MKNNGILKELSPKKVFAIIAAFLLGQALFGGIIYSVSNTHKIVNLQIKNEKTADERYRNLQKTADERYQNIMDFLKLSIENLEKIMNEKFKKVEDDIGNLEKIMNEKFKKVEDDISLLKGEITKIKIAIVKKHPDLAQDLISSKDNEKQTPKEKFTGMGGSDEE